MKTSVVILALLSIAACTQTASAAYTYDIKKSVDKIKPFYEAFITKIDIEGIIKLLSTVFGCIPPITLPGDGTVIDINKIWKLIVTLLDALNWDDLKPIDSGVILEKIREYVNQNTSDFEIIHDHIWTDEEFNNIIVFLRDAGYPDIYAKFGELYDHWTVPEEIRPPTGPPTKSSLRARSVRKEMEIRALPSFIKQEEGTPIEDLIKQIVECLLGKIGEIDFDIGLRELLPLVLVTYQETVTNPAMQVFLVKVSEPAKGISFQESRALPEVQALVDELDKEYVVENLNILLEKYILLPWGEFHISDYFLNILEYIIWSHSAETGEQFMSAMERFYYKQVGQKY